MSVKLKETFGAICFILIGGVIVAILKWVLMPDFYDNGWNHRKNIKGFYYEQDNSLDVAFLGASQVMSGIDPLLLFREYDIYSYDLGTSQQNIITSYYLYKELRKSQKPDVIIIEPTMLFDETSEVASHFGIDYINMSFDKFQQIITLKKNEAGISDEQGFLFPLYTYHMRWKELTRRDFIKSNRGIYYQKGFTPFFENSSVEYESLDNNEKEQDYSNSEIDAYKMEYLRKLIEDIKEDGIQVVLIKVPRCGWTNDRCRIIQSIAEEYDVDFWDYNLKSLNEEIKFDKEKDFLDGAHLNWYGAQKLTGSIGERLKNMGLVLGKIENQANYSIWKSCEREYANKISRIRIKEINNINNYLNELEKNKEDISIFISVKDESSTNLSEETMELLGKLGLKTNLKDKYRYSYLAIIDDDVIEDSSNEHLVKIKGTIGKSELYSVESAGYECGNSSSIIIGGVEFSLNQRGINIVVYDKVDNCVIDSVSFDTFSGNQGAIRMKDL